MKKAKRFLSILLMLCMILGLFPSTVFAAKSSMPFTDVEESDWFYEAVQYVYEKSMMNGTGASEFSPDATTTRGMIVTILHRMEGTPSAVGEVFADVAAGQYYANAVAWASANAIVGGYGNGNFGPNDPITREQMATILYRYVQYKGYDSSIKGDVSTFADGNQVSSYAVEAMDWVIGMGLISGVGNNTLSPAGSATRAQVATILMRFCNAVVPTVYTVTFEYNYDNKGVYKTVTVESGETVDKPANPTRSGYSFNGWYTSDKNGEKFDFDTIISEDITLYAKWEENSYGDSYWEPPVDNTECTLKISITNGDYSEETRGIVTQSSSYLLTGIVENGVVSKVDVVYHGYDEETKVGRVTGTSQWSVEIPLEIGTNTVTITVYDNNNLFVTKDIYINRTNAEVTYSDGVKIADAEDYQRLDEDFIACWTDDNLTEDESDDTIVILAKDDALLLSQIEEGLLSQGEVYMIPQNEIFVTGFTAVYEYHRAPNGTDEYPISEYPDSEYEEIVFSYPDFADLFASDVSLDFSSGVDSDNPIAFAMLADGTSIDLQTETQQARTLLRSGMIGNPLYPRAGWQPQELAKNALPSAVYKVDQYNRFNLTLNWNDIVIYDHDGVENDGTVDYGQLKLSGKVGVTNLQYTGGIEWHPNFIPWELDLLPQQIISKLEYDFGGSLTVKGDASVSTTELVKALNDGFENESEFWGMSVSGVSSLKNKWVLGVVGLNLVPPSATFGTTIKGQAAKSTLSPSLILVLFIDMDGNITVEGALSFGYETEVVKGFNIQKNGYTGSYGSQNQNRSDKHYNIGFDRTLDVYDENEGSFSLTFGGKVEASLDLGVGIGGGLMIGGICPAIIDGEIFYRANGLVEGELQFLPEFDANGYASLYHGIGVQTDLAAKLFVDTKIGDAHFDVNKHFEHMFWEQTESTACLDGIVYVSDDDGNNDNNAVISGASVKLTKNDTGKIWTTTTDSDGKYKFTSIPDGEYTLEVQKTNYDSYINENLIFSKKLTQNVFLNQQAVEVEVELEYDGVRYLISAETQEATLIEAIDETQQTFNLPDEVPYNGKNYRVTVVGDDAFGEEMWGVKITHFPQYVTKIGVMAFYGSDLSAVTIPSGIEYIAEYGLYDGVLPSSVTLNAPIYMEERSLGTSELFSLILGENFRLNDCQFASAIGNGVWEIRTINNPVFSAVDNVLYQLNGDEAVLIWYGTKSGRTEFTVPLEVGFNGTNEVPVTGIAREAFNIHNLSSLTLTRNISSIDRYAISSSSYCKIYVQNYTVNIAEDAIYVSNGKYADIYSFSGSSTHAWASTNQFVNFYEFPVPVGVEGMILYPNGNCASDVDIVVKIAGTEETVFETHPDGMGVFAIWLDPGSYVITFTERSSGESATQNFTVEAGKMTYKDIELQ